MATSGKPPCLIPIHPITNRSGGVDVGDNANIGRDVVGRDKTESAGGHIVHAGSGATVIIGERPAPVPPDLSPAPVSRPSKACSSSTSPMQIYSSGVSG